MLKKSTKKEKKTRFITFMCLRHSGTGSATKGLKDIRFLCISADERARRSHELGKMC